VALLLTAAATLRPAAAALRPAALPALPAAPTEVLRALARVVVLARDPRVPARVDGAGRAPVAERDVVRARMAGARGERVLDRPPDRGVSRALVLRPPTVGRPGPRELTAPPRDRA
jgi:hypothetical protein